MTTKIPTSWAKHQASEVIKKAIPDGVLGPKVGAYWRTHQAEFSALTSYHLSQQDLLDLGVPVDLLAYEVQSEAYKKLPVWQQRLHHCQMYAANYTDSKQLVFNCSSKTCGFTVTISLPMSKP